jgi:hypothetical protein
MTALKQYQRLESTGLWRDDPQDQRREVLVRFGEATLVLSDPKSEVALSHWSLPAVERLNPGVRPAVYSPGADALETLEIDDDGMIAALEVVHNAVAATVPRPGRLRGAILGGVTALILAMGVFWVPGALLSHTAAVIPAAKRAELGQRALDDVVRLTGAPCAKQDGLRALAALSEGVFGPADTPILYVLRQGLTDVRHLPGGVILLSSDLIEKAEGPEVAAGAAIVAGQRALAEDPMLPLLRHAGLIATFRLLTTGDLPPASLQGYGEVLLKTAPEAPPAAALLAAFEAAQVPATPYAATLDPATPPAAVLIAGDPFKGLSPSPLIPDGDWVALQQICTP